MSITDRLALKQLILNKKRTIITVIGIMLSVSMITAVSGFVASTRDMMIVTYQYSKGDYHVSFHCDSGQQAETISSDSRIQSSYVQEIDGSKILFARLKNLKRNYEPVAEEIAKNHGATVYSYNKELMAAEGIIADDQSLMTVYAIAGILGAIILAGSIIVISNAFYISASERKKQFGTLKSVGATSKQIRQSVIAEGLLLSVIGIPLGVLLGFLVQWIALSIANVLLYEINELNHGILHFRVVFSPLAITISMIVSFSTILLSAWLPARRASKLSAIDAIRLSDDVRSDAKPMNVNQLYNRLFGFEGFLATKMLKRNKGKYRAGVISLVVSIILLIISTGFGKMITKSTEMLYMDYGVNVLMRYTGGDKATGQILTQKIADLKPETIISLKIAHETVKMPSDFLSKDAIKYSSDVMAVDDENVNTRIIAVDDNAFEKICRLSGIDKGIFEENKLEGILVNLALRDQAGKRVEFTPFQYQTDMKLYFNEDRSSLQELKLVAETNMITTEIALASFYDEINVIVPLSIYDSKSGFSQEEFNWYILSDDPAEFTESSAKIFDALCEQRDYYIFNYERGARMNKNIGMLMMIFVYGFIGMMSLIAVTSVISTISTSVSLRRQEFATLLSMGMTMKSLKKMLAFESLFYGLKSIGIGLPLGMAIYCLLYKAFIRSIDFAFLFPTEGFLLSILGVFLITSVTMRYSSQKIKKGSIIEFIKDANI